MKKNYCLLFICIVSLICPSQTHAQIVANADFAEIASGSPQIAVTNVVQNDTHNTNPLLNDQVILTQNASSSNLLALQTDGSVAILSPGLSDGVYWLEYQICLRDDAQSCEIGRCTIFINHCAIPAPQFTDVLFLPCSTTGNLPIANLPTGNWILRQTRNGVFISDLTGLGSTTQVAVTQSGLYGFTVLSTDELCQSAEKFVTISEPACTVTAVTQNKGITDSNGNGITDPGDLISLKVTVYNPLVTVIDHLSLTGFAQIGSSEYQMGGNTYSTQKQIRALYQTDINSGVVNGTLLALATYVGQSSSVLQNIPYNIPLPTPRGFRLLAFVDTNTNGILDSGEPFYKNGVFRYTVNDAEPHFRYEGGYVYEADPAAIYDFEFQLVDDYQSYYSVSNSTIDNATAGLPGIQTLYFPITPLASFQDVSVKLYATQTLPGINSVVHAFVQNRSHVDSPLTTLTFNHTVGQALVNPTFPYPLTITPNGYTSDMSLAPFSSRNYFTRMAIPDVPVVNAGDVISYSANVTASPDLFATNNAATFPVAVTATYQTNDMYEGNGPEIPIGSFNSDDYLRFTIRYDNLNEAVAYNITITTLLDEQLDENSARLYLSGNAAYIFERVGRLLTWKFPSIYSSTYSLSDNNGYGFIQFEVKPKPGYAIGDVISSSAQIHFDLKPAVATNVWQTEFVDVLHTEAFVSEGIKMYPNPAKDVLKIEGTQPFDSVTIFDILGHPIIEKSQQTTAMAIDLSGIASGVYMVKVMTGTITKTIKIIKE